MADMLFVPSGELWEAVKADFIDYMEYDDRRTDKEIWAEIKTLAVECEAIPIKSGFLCWHYFERYAAEEFE